MEPLLADSERFDNYQRPHASLKGQTPYERYLALEKQIPIQTDVTEKYWQKQETIRPRNYQYLRQKKLKHLECIEISQFNNLFKNWIYVCKPILFCY